jgi:serine/threonine-protein kinase
VSQNLLEQLQIALGEAYHLERELGGGGMSRVFLALDRMLNRRVVVKVLLPELAAGVNVERFRREILLAAQLQHPHIVPLLSAGEAGGLPYFIMPFVAGESLRARMTREGELPIAETVRVLRDVVSALAYAHSCGVVHRDVKPDNVLISGGVAVVTDFGVAKAVSASTDPGSHTGITSLGVALGTPTYMAPEQATANPQIDHRADLYSFGAMAYEMLTGQPPFAGRSPQAMLAAHVMDEPEAVERRRPAVPLMLGGLVRDCLAKRPADRPQTATEVMYTLDALATPTGGTAPTTVIRVSPPGARRRVLAGAALAAVGVLAAVGGILWSRGGPGEPGVPSAPSAPAAGEKVGALPPADSVPPSPGRQSAPPVVPTRPPAPEPRADEVRPAPESRRAPGRAEPAERPPAEDRPAPIVPQRMRSVDTGGIAAPRDSARAGPTEADSGAATTPPVTPAPVDSPAPAPPPEPAPPPAAAPPPPALPPPRPIDHRPEIRGVIARYAGAVESRNLGALKRIYPGMTGLQERGWEQFFQLVRDVRAKLDITRLDVSNETADAEVKGTYTYLNTSTQRSERQPVSFHAILRREGGGWRILEVR